MAPAAPYNNLYYLAGLRRMEMKRAICHGLALFYLTIFFLAIGSSGLSAQNMGEASGHQMGRSSGLLAANSGGSSSADALTAANESDSTVDVLVQNWKGYATKEDSSYPVRLNVETIRTVDPDEARRLMASNMSLEEVIIQARSGDRETILRGSVKLNNDSYLLTDITIASSGNSSVLEAKVANNDLSSGQDDAESIVGRMVVTISAKDDNEVAEGYMVMDDSRYSGTYSLSMTECSGQGPRAGKMGRAD